MPPLSEKAPHRPLLQQSEVKGKKGSDDTNPLGLFPAQLVAVERDCLVSDFFCGTTNGTTPTIRAAAALHTLST